MDLPFQGTTAKAEKGLKNHRGKLHFHETCKQTSVLLEMAWKSQSEMLSLEG